jgi:hypothetical protein
LLPLDSQVMTFPSTCSACNAPCETRMYITNIPYFKEVIVMASTCDQCGYKNSELKPGGAIPDKGRRMTVKVSLSPPHSFIRKWQAVNRHGAQVLGGGGWSAGAEIHLLLLSCKQQEKRRDSDMALHSIQLPGILALALANTLLIFSSVSHGPEAQYERFDKRPAQQFLLLCRLLFGVY